MRICHKYRAQTTQPFKREIPLWRRQAAWGFEESNNRSPRRRINSELYKLHSVLRGSKEGTAIKVDGTANAPVICMTERRLLLFCGDGDNDVSPARRFAGLSGYYCMGVFMELIASKESSLVREIPACQ